jgi:4-hydroxy-3-methylbut-2-en-1-yl diphosphate synthase IspG/GcpE
MIYYTQYTHKQYTSNKANTSTETGSEHPIALQTMTTAMTTDVQGSIDQVSAPGLRFRV